MTTPLSAPKAGATAAAAASPKASERAKMQAVAKQFEAVFLRQMIGSMRQAGLAEGAMDSSATDQFRDMADARTADSMANTGGFGIAQLLMRQFDAKAAATGAPAPKPAANKEVTVPVVDSGT